MFANSYLCFGYFIITVIILKSGIKSVFSLQCMDHDNTTVDWFVMYKLPSQKKKTGKKLIDGGVAYLYLTSRNNTLWTLSNISVNKSNSLLGLTLQPLYKVNKENDQYHILYNDEPLNKNANKKKGHTKGVILGNENGGLWLIHSVPLFPPLPEDEYSFPTTGRIYGQSIICISFNLENMNNVGLQLRYNEPDIYSKYISGELGYKLPHLNAIIEGHTIDTAPWYHTQDLQSLKGVNFKSFAKSKNFNKELYVDFVAPVLKSNLYVQTWPNGAGRLRSNCSKPFFAKNIKSMYVNAISLEFNATRDHSKWAVSKDAKWICIGDINRAEHQMVRGGGTICINNSNLASNYNQTIKTVETCSTKD